MSKLALNQQLWNAVVDGRQEIVEAALVAGADPDFRDAGDPDETRHQSAHARSVLHEAILLGRFEAAQLLLKHGAEQSCDGLYELAPLHLATLFGQEDLMEEMLQAGGDVQALAGGGDSVLMTALIGEDAYDHPGRPIATKQQDPRLAERMVRRLVEAGADINGANEAGETPLWNAVRYQDAATVEAMIGLGADAHLQTAFGTNLVAEGALALNQADAMAQMPWRAEDARNMRQRALEVLRVLHAQGLQPAKDFDDADVEAELHYPNDKIQREILGWWGRWDAEAGHANTDNKAPSIRSWRRQGR